MAGPYVYIFVTAQFTIARLILTVVSCNRPAFRIFTAPHYWNYTILLDLCQLCLHSAVAAYRENDTS